MLIPAAPAHSTSVPSRHHLPLNPERKALCPGQDTVWRRYDKGAKSDLEPFSTELVLTSCLVLLSTGRRSAVALPIPWWSTGGAESVGTGYEMAVPTGI